MSFVVKEPVLVIGLGGLGSKLANEAKNCLNSDCLIISNDSKDFSLENESIHVSTDSIINPSVQLIRGSTYKVSKQIESKISQYSTIVLISNLAGKAGSAIAPVISKMCKETDKGLISFVVMPFKYEKERIFNSGVALKRIRENSQCTIVLDNDSLLESNPDLTPKSCYSIANSAIIHVIKSLETTEISSKTNILTTSKDGQSMEESLRDSLKMLYQNAPPNAIKSSMLYVAGGENIPVGMINSIKNIACGITNESSSQINISSSDESKIVMLSSIQTMAKFDSYDPLGMIPKDQTLDWETPDCSIDCKLDLYQLE
ncbi:MAG: cell division protein FtsZ [Candidatus Nitrosopumilus limneticus]|nr:putative Cell division protein FtsZ [Candidatus Nitrosopumilus limneticus]MDC4212104.1 cell division protein FtsZ [Candidatus Nitrosopumilus limneticus]MDC4213851.1 cell division protein FtsZ [Candidatus Nitrosopumilus limneticus]MDC4214777.1 cell division protein FtsZ [Candidatus Nitrosopumilus limneticus]MDC4216036.1 cell division protein FtsZ [Candidatus Nitrosopumilus limneticus]